MSGRQILIWLRRNRHVTFLLAVILVLVFLLLARRAVSPPETRFVEVTRVVPVTLPAAPARIVTRVVVVTPTPIPSTFENPEPNILRVGIMNGPRTLDPAQATDASSAAIVNNVLETLVYPHPTTTNSYLPLLATRWQIDEEGTRYTFTLRRGVSFSDGSALTAEDVVYSLRRLLLQSPAGGPQGLLLEPLFGYTSGDVTEEVSGGAYAGNRAALQENVLPLALRAVCERVEQAVYVDESGHIVMELSQPWAPLLAALSQPWAGVVSREWAIERGDWDGSCQNWSRWYAPLPGETPLATAILGSGPYILDHWTPGNEYVLVANEGYWRSSLNPMWQGGPAGLPRLARIHVVEIAETHRRWELLRSGVLSTAPLSAPARFLADQMVGQVCGWNSATCVPSTMPAEPLRRYEGLPRPDLTALLFNFNIAATSRYIGSGQLDGAGIPPNFFSDLHVRRAFAYCLDEVGYITRALGEEGALSNPLLPPWWQAAADPVFRYNYDSGRCNDELQLAWGNQLPATGFQLQIPYLAGDSRQQLTATILQEQLHAINSNYRVETVGLPPDTYLQALRTRQLPLALINWQAALPDPHYHLRPLFDEDMSTFQQLPVALAERFDSLLLAGREATGLETRWQTYSELEDVWLEQLPFLLLPRATTERYEQRWLSGWFYHPARPVPYYYAYEQVGEG